MPRTPPASSWPWTAAKPSSELVCRPATGVSPLPRRFQGALQHVVVSIRPRVGRVDQAASSSAGSCTWCTAARAATTPCGTPRSTAPPEAGTRGSPGHSSGAGPAAVADRDGNAPAEDRQLFVVHRGYGNRAADTDAAAMEALIPAEEHAAGTARATLTGEHLHRARPSAGGARKIWHQPPGRAGRVAGHAGLIVVLRPTATSAHADERASSGDESYSSATSVGHSRQIGRRWTPMGLQQRRSRNRQIRGP